MSPLDHEHPVDAARVAAARAGVVSVGDAGRLAGLLGMLADPTGRYLLIAASGPRGYGEILRSAIGERQLAGLAAGAIRAAWA
jgi:hypothetical protein